jgi:arylsulfatase A-like enzyme/tetratricopeptide (TPR) repeat protein
MRTKLILVAILILLIGGFIYWKTQNPTAPHLKNFNVVLITIDTLRADHLPSYGYTKIRTPNIDRFAAESLVFEDAVAHAPMTLPSHVSILTGLLPPYHGVRDNAGFILESKRETLAETLKKQGYKTAAFISSFVLDSQFGLDQGFDLYSDNFALAEARIDNTDVFRRAEETQQEVNSWLEQNHDKPFFLWVHYYDPHDPYDPPEPYKAEYATSPYDGEIAYTDREFGKLMDSLDRLQLKENTIVVMTGDHGEGLGEHREQTHSLFIYNATQHVPLMIRVPKVKAERIQGIVNHVDISPTLLEWLEVKPVHQIQGKSLVPLIIGKEKSKRTGYSESIFPELHYGWSPLKGITTEEYKFIDAPNPELYDRKTDRSELKNLAKEKAQTVITFQNQLNQILQFSGSTQQAQKMDPEAEEKLRALGYTGTIIKSTEESRKVDPKERIELLETVSRAHKALDIKNYRSVIETTTWVLQQEPRMIDAQFMLSTAYLNLNEMDKALIEMMKTIHLKPDHIQTLYNLGFFYQLQGNLNEAEKWYLDLLKYSPSHLRGTLNLINIYRQKNEIDKAKNYYSKINAIYNEALKSTTSLKAQSSLLEKLAQASFAMGDSIQSESTLKKAIELDPKNFNAYLTLGLLYRRSNRLEEATTCFKNAIQINDEFYPAYYQLAEAHLASNKNLEEALRLIEKANSHTYDQRGESLKQAILNKLNGSKN